MNKIIRWLCKHGIHLKGKFVKEEYLKVFPYPHFITKRCTLCGKEYVKFDYSEL